ncbi:15-hydroxyprostaglandin dehydrogenase [NAD(+)]-like [Phymastichus coffea]|uniref:15-hydroxyprostaglandin dehydrogenase [NAD(+)]-like n=1 Tax=Phymastichus coffea TaxID=108790 RepID=UPI00273CC92E|nr:15-hydroxyprostaglandin dehydrogenase [NAD(+)]-like [Phymastichus coffea]
MNDLKEKVVVITGGSSGIGLAIVKQLLNTEIKFLAMFELDHENSRKIVKDLEKVYKSKIGLYPCDVSKTSQLEENFEKVFQTYNTVDILINNAGIAHEDNPELMMDVNYKAVVLASLMVIKRIGKHKGGEGGTIVNIASTLGLQNIFYPIYCSTKHAVVSFTRTMEQHYETTGVRVVAICPGLTDTPILDTTYNNLEFNTYYLMDISSLKKQSPDTVAAAVMKIIKEGNCGSVWVVDNDEPPFAVKYHPQIDLLANSIKSNL